MFITLHNEYDINIKICSKTLTFPQLRNKKPLKLKFYRTKLLLESKNPLKIFAGLI